MGGVSAILHGSNYDIIYIGIYIAFSYRIHVSLYGSWEDLVARKIVLRDVGIICPPGKPNNENFVGGLFWTILLNLSK